jgi:hypothetical protein
MESLLWNNYITRIEVATGRHITSEQANTLYDSIKNIDDRTVTEAVERYLTEEIPQRNIERYIKNYSHEIIRESKLKKEAAFESGHQTGEVSPYQHAMFFRCIALAVQKYFGEEYTKWVTGFNECWMALTDKDLDNFLKKEAEILSTVPNKVYLNAVYG